MIHTPRLCGEPIFVGQGGVDETAAEKRKKALNVIDCRPVVKDEVLALASAPANQPVVEALPKQEAAVSPPVAASPIQENGPGQPEADKATPADTKPQTGLQAEDQKYADEEMDFVLVVDPATGEMKLETSEDGGGILSDIETGNLDAAEIFSSTSLDDLMNKLKEVIGKTAQQLGEGPQGQAAAAEGAGQQQAGALRTRPHKQKVDLPNLTEQQKADKLSRLTRSGAHNHKAIAEAFLKGQTKQAPGQTTAQQKLPEQQRQLGTAQYRNLKRAFGTKWDDDGEAKKQNDGVGKAVGEL